MHSPSDRHGRGDPNDASGPDETVQDTLDTFDTAPEADPGTAPVEARADGGTAGAGGRTVDRQESIDAFLQASGPVASVEPGSRARKGIEMELCLERVALTEAARGIMRDELLLTMARECQVPLERLDLVDAFLTDLELEGRTRSVEDLVVLVHEGDEDILSLDLTRDEFLEHYRRRHDAPRGGG